MPVSMMATRVGFDASSDFPFVTGQTLGAFTMLTPYGVVCTPELIVSDNAPMRPSAWRSSTGSIHRTSGDFRSAATSLSLSVASKALIDSNPAM